MLLVDGGEESWCWPGLHWSRGSEGSSPRTIKEQGLRDFCCNYSFFLLSFCQRSILMMLSLQITTLIIFLHLVSSYDIPLCDISFKLINSNVRSLMSPSNTLFNFSNFLQSQNTNFSLCSRDLDQSRSEKENGTGKGGGRRHSLAATLNFLHLN